LREQGWVSFDERQSAADHREAEGRSGLPAAHENGRSSEQLEQAQLELVDVEAQPPIEGESTTPASTIVAVLEEHRKKRARQWRPNLRGLPAHLPRRTVMHWPTDHQTDRDCPACGLALREIGQDVSEMLMQSRCAVRPTRSIRSTTAWTLHHVMVAAAVSMAMPPGSGRLTIRPLNFAGMRHFNLALTQHTDTMRIMWNR